MCKTLGELANYAAEKLPEGWEIRLQIERHGGSVDLYHNGNPVNFLTNYEDIADDFENAVKHAIEQELEDAIEAESKSLAWRCARCDSSSTSCYIQGVVTKHFCRECYCDHYQECQQIWNDAASNVVAEDVIYIEGDDDAQEKDSEG